MIKLRKVSKFYYSKGVIATGFSKVDLDFRIGEFIAITGESGSGKSTLINVVSGLETYEEGEMYVKGKETSHYLEKDWEIYRRNYIGNIYQNFNLINSYTVYQNVELILSLNGVPKKERKIKVLNLIKKVGLTKYKNTKVSKLSGGQKQRVAIARALAKDVPVIIADEPTGSLDKASAENIIKLLSEIAKEKLVIIVTHNYDLVEKYVTRKITMHDGKILEDKKLKTVEKIEEKNSFSKLKNIRLLDKFFLGFRNTFNVIPKFILLFLVYSFIVCALMTEYAAFKQGEYEASKDGSNVIFKSKDDHRVVMNKKDRTAFTNEELDNIKNMSNIKRINTNDIAVDTTVTLTDEKNELWLTGYIDSLDNFNHKVDFGRLPENENEIVIEGALDDYYLTTEKDLVLNQKLYYLENYGDIKKDKVYTVVGIRLDDPVTSSFYSESYTFYLSDHKLTEITYLTHQKYSQITIDFMGKNYRSSYNDNYFKLQPNNWVSVSYAIIPESFKFMCDKSNCLNKDFNVTVKNIYYEDIRTFKVEKYHNEKNAYYVLDLPGYEKKKYGELYEGIIYINPIDYDSLFNKGTYQISAYVDDIELIEETVNELEKEGYHTLQVKDTLVNDDLYIIVRTSRLITTILLVITLFFISYFIIKIILKSRNIYFSILRMLGASKNICRQLLIIELFVVSNISYFIFILLAELNKTTYMNVKFIDMINNYLKFNDYITLYFIITFISLIISIRYASNLFKNSVMNTYREEI